MQPYNKQHITSIGEVEDFFRHLVYDLSVNFHPDNDFADCVEAGTGKATFTPEEARTGNALMEECFEVCEKEDVDIYELGLPIIMRA